MQKTNLNTLGVNGDEEEEDMENENQPLNNVILIGTKKDLCYENLPAGHRANQRSVPFSKAEELCRKLRLSGCVETSNQWPHRYGY